MKQRLIHLIGAMAILLAIAGSGFGAGTWIGSTVRADSPYCSAAPETPFRNGPAAIARGHVGCVGATIRQVQVSLYRNGVRVANTVYNYSGAVNVTQDASTIPTWGANFQAWTWEYDSKGYTEGRWSATVWL